MGIAFVRDSVRHLRAGCTPVRPGSMLSIELQPESGAARGVRFDVRCDGVLAVTGRWAAVPESA